MANDSAFKSVRASGPRSRLEFPPCWVEHFSRKGCGLKWYAEGYAQDQGLDYWHPVKHDPEIDPLPPGPGGLVRRGDLFLCYASYQAIQAHRDDLYAEQNRRTTSVTRGSRGKVALANIAKKAKVDDLVVAAVHDEGKAISLQDVAAEEKEYLTEDDMKSMLPEETEDD